MNITPRIKSARNRNNIIVNLCIEIPFKGKIPISHRSQETSLSPSPNKLKKKYKLIATPMHQKKTMNSSHINTMRDTQIPHVENPPSRKKYSNPTPNPNHISKGALTKFKSCDLSPKKKGQLSKRSKQGSKIVRNISILEQVINEDDNMIKYTTNSNELREKSMQQAFQQSVCKKMQTHISEIDIAQIRKIQNQSKQNRQKYYLNKINDLLRTACAKKIQRAWKNYKTKKLIRSYSNDIRSKYSKSFSINSQSLTVRSQGMGMKFKKKLLSFQQIQAKQEDSQIIVSQQSQLSKRSKGQSSELVKKIQEDNMEKWESFLQQIKKKKNLDAALQFSLQRTKELKKELTVQFFKEQLSPVSVQSQNSANSSQISSNKIIKTKKYYQSQRQKWRQNIERSNGSIIREERVNYFENQMLRLQNDYSQSGDSEKVNSFDLESERSERQLQEIQNVKLRKKLQIFRTHLPQLQASAQKDPNVKPKTSRMDIATIIRKKNQITEQLLPQQNKQDLDEQITIKSKGKSNKIQIFEFDPNIELIQNELKHDDSEQIIKTHRQWKPIIQYDHHQDLNWKNKLEKILKNFDSQMNKIILEQLILEALIEISESQQLISFIKNIYEKSKPSSKKPEGIVTNHTSIKDYLNYFINYIYESKLDNQIYSNLLKPLGPTSHDVLKYFRGEDIQYDPDSESVMSIKIFNQQWQYANQLIYFDKKYDDQKKEIQRVNYLKHLTKIFFRSIFDCYNQSLQPLRIYGLRGKPFPWSQQKLKIETPILKRCLSLAYQRVLRYSLVFAGALFADKQHNFDSMTIDEIQQGNIVKLLTIQLSDEQPLWMHYQDELTELKLELTKYVEDILLKEMVKVIGVRSLRL